MQNTELSLLLNASTLSPEARHDLLRIFPLLPSTRQIEILDRWPVFLEALYQIEGKAEQAKQLALSETLSRISSLIDEATLRDRARQAVDLQKSKSQQEDTKAGEIYQQGLLEKERQKKLELLQKV